MVMISYWQCAFHQYDEIWDGEEECRIYGCTHKNGDGCCDIDNKLFCAKADCKLLDDENTTAPDGAKEDIP